MTYTQSQIAAMSDAELSIRIASAMGWLGTVVTVGSQPGQFLYKENSWNPPGNMSQVWECEEYLESCDSNVNYAYANILTDMVKQAAVPRQYSRWDLIHAPPRQRSEAILQALQEIKESKHG